MTSIKRWVSIGVAGLAAATLGAVALAQGGPPPGGAAGGPGAGGPGMARAQPTAQEQAGLDTLKGFGALLDQGKVDEAFEKYVSKDFNDHSEMLRTMTKKKKVGFEDAKGMFKKMGEMGGSSGQKVAFVQQATADDEMVTAKGRVGQDIYRVVDGKITDHWDTLGGFTGGPPAGGAGGPPGGGAGGPPGGGAGGPPPGGAQ